MVFSVGLSAAVSSTVAGAGAGADFAGEEARVVSLIASMHLKDLFLYCCAVAVGVYVHFFLLFVCLPLCSTKYITLGKDVRATTESPTGVGRYYVLLCGSIPFDMLYT